MVIMTSRRTRRTHIFRSNVAAVTFASWLRNNRADDDYGRPSLIHCLDAGPVGYVVEYEYNTCNPVPFGVALGLEIGIDGAANPPS